MQQIIEDVVIEESKVTQYYCNLNSIMRNGKKIPLKLDVCRISQKEPIISICLDSIDYMNFCRINLKDLQASEKLYVLDSLQRGLNRYGGKCIFAVNKKDVQLVKEKIGIDLDPTCPPDNKFRELFYVSFAHNPQEIAKFKRDSELFERHATEYFLLMNDKAESSQQLTAMTEKLSQLLILNTTWAKNQPSKRTYEPEGMFFRINNPNVKVYVLFKNNNPNEPIAFARMHQFENIYYFGDFVVHANYRKHGIGKFLMYEIFRKIPDQSVICLIAGGDKHAREFYEKIGFQRMTDLYNKSRQTISIDDDTVLMSGVLNPGPLRQLFLENFPERNFESGTTLTNASPSSSILLSAATPKMPVAQPHTLDDEEKHTVNTPFHV